MLEDASVFGFDFFSEIKEVGDSLSDHPILIVILIVYLKTVDDVADA